MGFLDRLFGKKESAGQVSGTQASVQTAGPAQVARAAVPAAAPVAGLSGNATGVVARGAYRVNLGHLGEQAIRVTILKSDPVLEQYLRASIGESGARHVFITGVLSSTVFSDISFISMPAGDYSVTYRYIPRSAQSQALSDFAALRRRKPGQSHILVCATDPVLASDCGIFDEMPQAADGAGVYVVGYGARHLNLLANACRCVNVPGKAKGFVHSVVLLDSPRITNEQYDRLCSTAAPVEKLRFLWDMADQDFGPGAVPLLGVTDE